MLPQRMWDLREPSTLGTRKGRSSSSDMVAGSVPRAADHWTEGQLSESGWGIGLVLSREQGDTTHYAPTTCVPRARLARPCNRWWRGGGRACRPPGSELLELPEMKAVDTSVAPSDTAPVPNPAAVYLDRLHPSGRRSMRRALDCAVAIFTDEKVTDATEFDWSEINQKQVQELRSAMVSRGAAASTVNQMLSGVRSTVRIAGDRGLVGDKTRIAVENERNEKPPQQRVLHEVSLHSSPSRRRRAGRYVKPGEVRRLFAASGTDPIGARDVAMLALLYGAGLQRSEAVALQLADYDQVSGAITVRHDARQVYATDGGKEAIDAWIERRGDWPGALLCPVAKGGRIQPRDMTAQAVMVRVRAIAKQAGVDLVTPNDLRLTYLTELERQQLDARRKGMREGLPALVMLSVPYQAPSFNDQSGGRCTTPLCGRQKRPYR